ncbi:MAG: hypothetical protein PUF78_06905 [Lachnospiraceae bacterium]|nr:hypothetical protein [Lachnospiraceae bacterium]
MDFAKSAIESYTQICNSILEKNDKSQTAVIQGYQTVLDALAKQLEKPNLTEESRKLITEDMISVADKIAMADERNKKFFLDAISKIGFYIVGAFLGKSSNMSTYGTNISDFDKSQQPTF